jgi:hypothetical protein
LVYNTTYNLKSVNADINALVGKPISFLQRIKLGGIGSGRMIIQGTSPDLLQFLNAEHYITNASIELRPAGILVHINQGMRNFCWPIPYYHLVVYYTQHIAIHANESYIRFSTDAPNHFEFVKKILREKATWSQKLSFENPS